MNGRLGWASLLALVLTLGVARAAQADVYTYQVLFDTDNDPGTGCGVPVQDATITATFAGVERLVSVTVSRTLTAATITGITSQACVSGTSFGALQAVSPGGWPVGIGVGTGGGDVVEGFAPITTLGNTTLMRVAFTATRSGASDVIWSVNGETSGPAILFRLPFRAPAPLLSPVGLGASVLLLGAVGWWALRRGLRPRRAALLVAVALGGMAATAWALTIVMDGQVNDWGTLAPVATDPSGDSSLNDPADDLVAGFLTADGSNVYFRLDVRNIVVCLNRTDHTPIPGCCLSNAECTAPETCGGGGVANLCSLAIGWANLQWPPTINHTISTVNRTDNIYGQVWIDGVTNQFGWTPGLLPQVGYGPPGSNPAGNPAWVWADATFSVDAGNNDEFRGNFLPDAVGTFDYVYRYSTANGQAWLYADLNGPIPDGQIPPNPGKMTVNSSGDTTAPVTPTNLLVVSHTRHTIGLAWDAVLGDPSLFGYEVLRSDSSGGPYALLARVTVSTYTDDSVMAGATYHYVVRAVDTSFNRSGFSNEVSAEAAARTVAIVFNVTVPSSTDGAGRPVYITGFLERLDGGLPQWNPAGVVLTRVDATHWTITLTGDETTQIEYKYTLGDWDHVEKDAACSEIANRLLTLDYGTTGTQNVNDTVLNWRNVAPCGS